MSETSTISAAVSVHRELLVVLLGRTSGGGHPSGTRSFWAELEMVSIRLDGSFLAPPRVFHNS